MIGVIKEESDTFFLVKQSTNTKQAFLAYCVISPNNKSIPVHSHGTESLYRKSILVCCYHYPP